MQGKMLASVFSESEKKQVLVERDIPELTAKDGMLVKVKACGICGTDMRILRVGHKRLKPGAHVVLGHELSGEVVAVNPGLSWPIAGMRVAVAPNMGCGHCDMCVRGFTQLCPDSYSFGVDIDGGFQEYMLVPLDTIVQGNISEIPEGITYEEAALTEPFSCVVQATRRAEPKPTESVLIVGPGAIGIMFVKLMRVLGVGKIIVSGHSPERLKLAQESGADYTFSSYEKNLVEAVREYTGGVGVDVAIIAAASGEAQAQAIESLNYFGRINFFGTLPKGSEITPINSNIIHYKEINITGTTGQTIQDFRTAMALIGNRQVDLSGLVSHTFPLREIDKAFEMAQSKKGLKVLVCPDK